MKKQLVRLVAAGALLGFTGQLFAQGTTLTTLQGSRHAGPGAVTSSSSTFGVGITLDNGATYVSTASVSQTVQIRGEVRPEAADVGLLGDIFVVDRQLNGPGTSDDVFLMRNQSGTWVSWNVQVATLVPFLEDQTLDAVETVNMFTGTLGTVGDHRIFLGYLPPTGALRYHTSGLAVTITAAQTQTPQAQATALFASKISPNIVQNICISCHIANGAAGNVHTFLPGSGQAQLDANFLVMDNLLSMGKVTLLARVRGVNHTGGAVLNQGTTDYNDFEQFLTLLEQF